MTSAHREEEELEKEEGGGSASMGPRKENKAKAQMKELQDKTHGRRCDPAA